MIASRHSQSLDAVGWNVSMLFLATSFPVAVLLFMLQVINVVLIQSESLFIASGVVLYPLLIFLGIQLLQRAFLLFGAFNLLNLLIPVQMFVFRYLLDIPYSNWRAKVMDARLTYDGLKYINLYLSFLSLLDYDMLLRPPGGRMSIGRIRSMVMEQPPIMKQATLAGAALVNMVILAAFWGANRDEWIADAGVGDRFVLRFGSILMAFFFVVSLYSRGSLAKLGVIGSFATAILMSAGGFRFLGVMLVLNAAVQFLIRRRLNAKLVVLGIAFTAVGYITMLVFAYMRQSPESKLEALSGLATGRVPMEKVLVYAGTNEECAFYTFVFFLDKDICYRGKLYAMALVHQLPNTVWKEITSTMSTGRVIGAYAAPKWFADHDLNLGDYFFTEAFLDFSHAGPFIAIFVFYAIARRFERLKFADPYKLVFYTIAVSTLHTFVLYGTEIYLKNLLVVALASFLLKHINQALATASDRVLPPLGLQANA